MAVKYSSPSTTLSSTVSRHWSGAVSVEVGVLATVCALMTVGAWQARPAWDDGWLYLLLGSESVNVRGAMGDRPLVGAVWQRLADWNVIWPVGAVVHWFSWLGMGLVTWDLWRLGVRGERRLGLAAAVLACGPVLCKVQYVLICPVFTGQISSLLMFCALCAWLRAAVGEVKLLRVSLFGVGVALIFLAVLMSEYGVAAAGACAALLWFWSRNRAEMRGSGVVLAGLMWTIALVCYWIFLETSDAEARPGVRPANVLTIDDPGAGVKIGLARLATMTWRGSFGAAAEAAAQVSVLEMSDLVAVAVGGGLALAGGLAVLFQVRRARAGGDEGSESLQRQMCAFSVSLVVGILPVVVMGRFPDNAVTSRYWQPVLPVASCLSVVLMSYVLRPRLRWLVVPACVFVVGYHAVTEGLGAVRGRERVRELGRIVAKEAPTDGIYVAVLEDRSGSRAGVSRDYELTARLRQEWSSELGRRSWVFSGREEAKRYLRKRSESGYVIERSVRKVGLVGEVAECVWFEIGEDGGVNSKGECQI